MQAQLKRESMTWLSLANGGVLSGFLDIAIVCIGEPSFPHPSGVAKSAPGRATGPGRALYAAEAVIPETSAK
jgi:hypothetical protein